MTKLRTRSAGTADMRRQAEARLKAAKSPRTPARSAQDSARLLHELQVHQIELEMQNDELRQTRAEVEAGLTRYTDLYDFAPVGYLTFLRDGTIREANLAGASLLGMQRAGLMGMRLGLFVADADRPAFNAFLQKLLATGARDTCEVALLKEQRPSLYVRIDATPAGEGQEYRAAITDITHRKQAEETASWNAERLRSLAMELSLAEERERKRLATSLHDNLSQILTVAKMRLSVLRQSGGVAGGNNDLKDIEALVDRAVRSARSLTLQLSHPALYDLGFVAGAEWLVEDIQQLYGLKVNLSTITGPVPMDLRVRVVLFQCLRELLVNAAKHAHAAEATVRIALRGKTVHVTVQDRGVGFLPESLNVDKSLGSGFGLFSIRERLHNLGGRMSIRSASGKGTTVVLEVPAGAEEIGQVVP